MSGFESVEGLKHPEYATPAQTISNPVFYQSAWVRFFGRLIAACWFFHWHYILDVDSGLRLFQTDSPPSSVMTSLTDTRMNAFRNIKSISDSTNRNILRTPRINLFRDLCRRFGWQSKFRICATSGRAKQPVHPLLVDPAAFALRHNMNTLVAAWDTNSCQVANTNPKRRLRWSSRLVTMDTAMCAGQPTTMAFAHRKPLLQVAQRVA